MPPRKKAKVSHLNGTKKTDKPLAKRKGCLKDIPNFAVELQLEIFGHLEPKDLFNLSRTCKTFHAFFLHRSNQRLWEAALNNADYLPQKPPWMSIPAFTHLLYSPYCHNCACPNVRSVIWVGFARYCSQCLPQLICKGADITERIKDDDTPSFALLKKDLLEEPRWFLNPIDREDPKKTQNPSRSAWNRRPVPPPAPEYIYLVRHVNELVEEWNSLTQHDGDAMDEFYAKRQDLLKLQRKHAKECSAWLEKRMQDRTGQLQDGREQRFAQILKRLEDSGWKAELDYMGKQGIQHLSSMPVVKRSAKLTDKDWEKVQQAMNTFLNETRAKLNEARAERLKEEKRPIVWQRLDELNAAFDAYMDTLPRKPAARARLDLELRRMKPITVLVDAPISEQVTRENFALVMPDVVETLCAELRVKFEDILRPLIKVDRVPPGADILDLAVAVFYDGTSYETSSWEYRYPFASTEETEYIERGIQWMQAILTALGLDPDMATIDELERCGTRIRCATCVNSKNQADGRAQWVYSWEAAFWHTVQNNSVLSKRTKFCHNRWVRVRDKDMARVKELEAASHLLHVKGLHWCCALCPTNEMPVDQVGTHLEQQHQIEDVSRALDDGHIFWDPRSPPRLQRPPVNLSDVKVNLLKS